jgi:hypothetical protein
MGTSVQSGHLRCTLKARNAYYGFRPLKHDIAISAREADYGGGPDIRALVAIELFVVDHVRIAKVEVVDVPALRAVRSNYVGHLPVPKYLHL